jgi:hypothetical protein
MVRVDSDHGLVTLSCRKQRDAERFAEMHFRLVPSAESAVLELDPAFSFREFAEKNAVAHHRDVLLEALAGTPEPLSHGGWQERTGLTAKQFNTALESLRDSGLVEKLPGHRGRWVHVAIPHADAPGRVDDADDLDDADGQRDAGDPGHLR